jgi:hypothetical protein
MVKNTFNKLINKNLILNENILKLKNSINSPDIDKLPDIEIENVNEVYENIIVTLEGEKPKPKPKEKSKYLTEGLTISFD